MSFNLGLGPDDVNPARRYAVLEDRPGSNQWDVGVAWFGCYYDAVDYIAEHYDDEDRDLISPHIFDEYLQECI